ncbi:MAG: PRC-barrel domain-containing protein [Anaerolineae bacterium]
MASHTAKGLLGQPVITLDAGRRVGSIQEIIYNTIENRVTAIILSKPPVAGSAKAVPAEHILLFGADVTLVDSETSVIVLGEEQAVRATARASTNVIRTQVITTEGRRLGEVSDIFLDDKGNVLGYQLSHSIIRDALRGKPFVPVAAVCAVGEDAVLIDAKLLKPLPQEQTSATEETTSCPQEEGALKAEAALADEPSSDSETMS